MLTTKRVIDACRASGATLIYLSSAGALSDGIWGDDVGAVAGTGRALTYGRTKREAEDVAARVAGAFAASVCGRKSSLARAIRSSPRTCCCRAAAAGDGPAPRTTR